MSYFKLALVPDDFEVPEIVGQEQFRLRPLLMSDAVADYELMMSDYENFCNSLSPNPNYSQKDTYSLETDIKFLGWHECEFYYRKSSFVYAAEKKTKSKYDYRGVFYIYPSPKKDHDAAIYLWVKKSDPDDGLGELIFDFVQKWIAEKWPFKNPVYPGRTTSWEEYEKLPDGKVYGSQHHQWLLD